MRGRIAVFAIGAIAALAGLGFAAPNNPQMLAQRGASTAVPVDAEVVLAVDVSYSMDPEEQALQREGYMAALTSREFLLALKQGGYDWGFLAYSVGFGGSMIWFGSSAGVALSCGLRWSGWLRFKRRRTGLISLTALPIAF